MFDRVALCYLMLSVLKNILPILCMNLSYLSIYASIYISIYLQYLSSYLSIIYILFFLFIHPSSIQKPLVNGILPIPQAGAMFVGLRPGTWRRSPGEGLWRVALAVAQHSWGIGRRKNGDLARKPWGFIGNYGDLCFFLFFLWISHIYIIINKWDWLDWIIMFMVKIFLDIQDFVNEKFGYDGSYPYTTM